MSKRKTITQAFHVTSEDMTFEDQDGNEEQEYEKTDKSVNSSEVASDSQKSRFSGRAKKVKAIYDPSEHNGPVHKRKKEALEAAEKSKNVPAKTPTKAVKPTPVISPAKRPLPETVVVPKTKIPTPRKTPADVAKNLRMSLDETTKPPQKARKLSVMPIVQAVKEPSKRIQQRKPFKKDDIEIVKKKPRSRSVSIAQGPPSVISSSYTDEASTITLTEGEIPDVKTWTHQQVCDYFSNTLKFTKRDAAVFKDEEIDGETILIMKRSDIVTTKFQHLKLGTALKMWSHIIKFQTASSDPTQAWK